MPDSNRPRKKSAEELWRAYQQLPWYSQAAQAADDMARKFAEGASYGSVDRILGGQQDELTRQATERAGIPGTLMSLTGTIASPITSSMAAVGHLAKLTPAAISALENAAYAYASGAPDEAAKNAAIGFVVPEKVGKLLKHLGEFFHGGELKKGLKELAKETIRQTIEDKTKEGTPVEATMNEKSRAYDDLYREYQRRMIRNLQVNQGQY